MCTSWRHHQTNNNADTNSNVNTNTKVTNFLSLAQDHSLWPLNCTVYLYLFPGVRWCTRPTPTSWRRHQINNTDTNTNANSNVNTNTNNQPIFSYLHKTILFDTWCKINGLILSPSRFKMVYAPYAYLLKASSDQQVEKFVSKEQHLRDYVREIEKLKKMADEVALFPLWVPMHLFQLDCNNINSVR